MEIIILKIDTDGNFKFKQIENTEEAIKKEIGCTKLNKVTPYEELENHGIYFYTDEDAWLHETSGKFTFVSFDKNGEIGGGICGNIVIAGRDSDGNPGTINIDMKHYILSTMAVVGLCTPDEEVYPAITFIFDNKIMDAIDECGKEDQNEDSSNVSC